MHTSVLGTQSPFEDNIERVLIQKFFKKSYLFLTVLSLCFSGLLPSCLARAALRWSSRDGGFLRRSPGSPPRSGFSSWGAWA